MKCHIRKESLKEMALVKVGEQIRAEVVVCHHGRKGRGEDEMKTTIAIVLCFFAIVILVGIALISEINKQPTKLTQEQALLQSDEYMKEIFTYLVNDPSFQTEEGKNALAKLFPIIRVSIQQYLKWLYENNYGIVQEKGK